MKNKKGLFLDRDGVLNKLFKNRPPWNMDEIEIYDESKEIIQIAKKNGYIPIVVTNQPDAARGDVELKIIYRINEYICKKLSIEKYYICPHGYDNECDCRKPKPGMLINGALENNLNIGKCFIIGDRLKDIEAGKNAGCKTIYLNKIGLDIADYHVKNHKELKDLISVLLTQY